MKKWTMKEVVAGKLFWILVMTVVITYLFSKAVDSYLQYYYYEVKGLLYYHALNPIGVLLLGIVAFFISSALMSVFVRIRCRIMGESVETMAVYNEERKFKWHILYSYLLGYAALMLLCRLGWFIGRWGSPLIWPGEEFSVLNTFLEMLFQMALSMVLPLVIVIRGFKPCHRYIMRKTGTNVGLILVLESSEAMQYLPKRCRDDWHRYAILDILLNGEAQSISGALVVYRGKLIISWLIKVLKILGIVVFAVVFIVSLGLLATLTSAMDAEIDSSVASLKADVAADRQAKKTADAIYNRFR